MESEVSSISLHAAEVRERDKGKGHEREEEKKKKKKTYLGICPQITQINSPALTHIRKGVE
jgi:ribosomal protein S8E